MTDTPRLDAPFEAQFDAGRMNEWVITRLMRTINTADLVKVLAVYPDTEAVGFVDVQRLVQQQTTLGVVINNVPIYRLPYMRLQGGQSAVILDPVVGDLGVAVFAQRDITTAASTRTEGPAPTNRAYDSGDGLYLGGFLNAAPTQWLKFLPDAAGIEVNTPGDLTIQTGGELQVQVGGNLTVSVAGTVTVTATGSTWNGPVTFTSAITAPELALPSGPVTTHRHGGVQTGSGTSGTPVP